MQVRVNEGRGSRVVVANSRELTRKYNSSREDGYHGGEGQEGLNCVDHRPIRLIVVVTTNKPVYSSPSSVQYHLLLLHDCPDELLDYLVLFSAVEPTWDNIFVPITVYDPHTVVELCQSHSHAWQLLPLHPYVPSSSTLSKV